MSACELCAPAEVVIENALAYVRHEGSSLSCGHVIAVPKRHVADYFEMTAEEQAAIQSLLSRARNILLEKHSPDGFNVGVNIGKAAGQNRMHVHVHLIPHYKGDMPDPSGGIRRALQR